jgi:hypothetical protein
MSDTSRTHKSGKEGSISFLKKRNKKLLGYSLRGRNNGTLQQGKSFLVLFFKEELLPSPLFG